MLFVPRTQELWLKVVALATSLVALGFGIVTLFQFDYDRAGTLQFYGQHGRGST